MTRGASGARSWLFVPGDRPDRFDRAAHSGADAVVCDLEDAVAVLAKDRAREAVVRWLHDGGNAFVRVNATSTPSHGEDLAAIATAPGLQGVVVPKAEDPDAVTAVAALLGERPIVALVESAVGIARATDLAQVRRVERLAFGELDFALDVAATPRREIMLPIRTALVLAPRVAGIAPPIDGVTTTLLDDAAVVADAVHARTLGFGGKLCIHPRQVAAVNQAFNPSEDEIAWALGIVAAAESSDGGVVTTADGQMVDMPVIGRARQLLALLDRDLTKELRNAACARR